MPIEITDRWHLGCITKSITATMIARLVESGQMHWSDTIVQIFPDSQIHDDWKPVTFLQLLTDTAGAPKNFSFAVRYQWPTLPFECTQARQEAVLNVLAQKPTYPPGIVHILECRLLHRWGNGRGVDRRHLGRAHEARGF